MSRQKKGKVDVGKVLATALAEIAEVPQTAPPQVEPVRLPEPEPGPKKTVTVVDDNGNESEAKPFPYPTTMSPEQAVAYLQEHGSYYVDEELRLDRAVGMASLRRDKARTMRMRIEATIRSLTA